jgi:serine/threonine protein kinase
MALTIGTRLGQYDVTALIGEGGMGQVYQATDTKLVPHTNVCTVLGSGRSAIQ